MEETVHEGTRVSVSFRAGGDAPSALRTASPLAVFASFSRHRTLLLALARRDILSRYRGSWLGPLWTLASPLLLLAVYTFVFSAVFQARWDIELGSRADFSLMLFAGLIVYWLFSDSVNRAPGLMFENASYVKKVVFPLEILPWVSLLSSAFHAGVSLVVLLLAQTVFVGPPPWTVLLLPVLLGPVVLLTVGCTWLLASLGVYLRDLKQVVPVLTLMILFLCPIFYPASALPESFRAVLGLNPLAVTIEAFRALLFEARLPSVRMLAISWASTWAFAWLGLGWFQRTRRGFADVV